MVDVATVTTALAPNKQSLHSLMAAYTNKKQKEKRKSQQPNNSYTEAFNENGCCHQKGLSKKVRMNYPALTKLSITL